MRTNSFSFGQITINLDSISNNTFLIADNIIDLWSGTPTYGVRSLNNVINNNI